MVLVAVYIIKTYRFFFSPDHGFFMRGRARTCRFYPSCSEYTINALTTYGFIKGIWCGMRRIGRCHPFSRHDIYDPVK
ncbi:MAG: membrane protein insertion efficiency factor YidD [Candidatus Ryanbacteria bacterium CG10_big_fil_rev_8_21_14_0_10_43_42]|uniref:Putative membrane protein insertion efficiency factor n=1 Tax=Candidatus Ryanbacteria bacterium CG10_big_fil_rev_8_21_14_0_10_43_42 TaxID=1974864 RepID=A0A2M8KWD2_9BACT|nr:MAG: membrane protein insertion efficiency factor YidD [Candidatus Ryanbacteria bacterium CG10_big_fil_rev_8_21_14_0_10_43_42]